MLPPEGEVFCDVYDPNQAANCPSCSTCMHVSRKPGGIWGYDASVCGYASAYGQPFPDPNRPCGASCGDGVLDPPSTQGYWGEQCDDGNTVSGDGCDWQCQSEASSSSSRSSSSSAGTCDDNQDGDGDGLKDAESVLSCTDFQQANDIANVQFKKDNQESSYPNPWPIIGSINAVQQAFNQDNPAIKPYAVTIDQVPTGLQEG